MKIRNIWKDINAPLESQVDERGIINDIFYNTNINHVVIIDSKPGVMRGNHYYKFTTQHILITKGSLEYWYKKIDSDENIQIVLAKEGDMITTPPFEVHALVIEEEGNQFIVFSEGKRGGKDYESDTFRTDTIVK